MKDIISEVRKLRHHLAALIAQHDELVFHVCPMLENEYYRKTGNLEIRIQNRRYEIACLKRGTMAEREKLTEEHSVREDYPLTDENTDASLTEGYLVLVERLDPAVNVNGFENKAALYERARECYRDLDLTGIDILIHESRGIRTDESSDEGALRERVRLLDEAIRNQEREINRIKNSFPYTQLELLLNEEKLSDRISEYEHLLDELNDEYDRLLAHGALQ
jgi:hypothetical protein